MYIKRILFYFIIYCIFDIILKMYKENVHLFYYLFDINWTIKYK